MCLYPEIVSNPRYLPSKKNGGIIPAVKDTRALRIPRGCGHCIECRQKKANEWLVRLNEDIKHHTNGKWTTLTFSNESIKHLCNQEYKFTSYKWDGLRKEKILEENIYPIGWAKGYVRDNAIATKAMRLFNERWRKKYKKALRHWFITELGHNGTENIHLHGIIWTDESIYEIEKKWEYGHIWKGNYIYDRIINYVSPKTINYMMKYVTKVDADHKYYKSKILCSPGIGKDWIYKGDTEWSKFNKDNTNDNYRTNTGHLIGLPTYYRNQIYTDDQREYLWMRLLDKNERYICGERIDISKSEKEYYKILEFHRKRNKHLGYGDNIRNWNRIHYEMQRRELMHNRRVQ